ncbi:phage antirepressor KilAC domain-containing protein [Tessaracoccus massiliensis]|uniref:phage antirepressor KilAC domain-containing protein n=1 Tax=Tessaracoccus massiliensis TaxID=1522311 RepID=UPI00058B54B5|nr:phage antirepressor KilAC domain-containing protein [Tessaracoccus massiliensis]
MNLELFSYQDTPVRVVTIDGEPWFVLNDLAKVLGLTRSASQIKDRLDGGVRQTYPLPTAGGTQHTTIVSEAGMYEVVIRSDKPEAATFRRWITTEVLPSIRKTGSYGVARELTRRELALMVVEAEDALELERQKVAELEPSARAWAHMAATDGDMSVDHAAKVLARDPQISMGRNRLFDYMHTIGWTFRQGPRNAWHAYQAQIDAGRLAHKLSGPFLNHRTGDYEIPAPTLRITAKGLSALHRKLGGISDLSDLLDEAEVIA